MANVNGPFGLRPVRHMTGGCIRANEYSIESAYNTSIFTGDIVELTGTGTNVSVAAADNDENIGVFAGCRYVDASGDQQFKSYWPADTAGTEIVAYVYDDPQIIYEVQFDTLAEANIGLLFQWVVGTGSTSTGQSASYAANATGAATGAQLRLLRKVPRPDNAFGAYGKGEVLFAEHALAGIVAGVGGQ